MYFSEAKFDSTLGLDIKSISISNAGILVFLSTENFFDTFTPLFKVFIYAIGTLKRAGYHTLAVYDCDLSGTYAELSASAERVVCDFRDLDPDEFIEFARMVAMP